MEINQESQTIKPNKLDQLSQEDFSKLFELNENESKWVVKLKRLSVETICKYISFDEGIESNSDSENIYSEEDEMLIAKILDIDEDEMLDIDEDELDDIPDLEMNQMETKMDIDNDSEYETKTLESEKSSPEMANQIENRPNFDYQTPESEKSSPEMKNQIQNRPNFDYQTPNDYETPKAGTSKTVSRTPKSLIAFHMDEISTLNAESRTPNVKTPKIQIKTPELSRTPKQSPEIESGPVESECQTPKPGPSRIVVTMDEIYTPKAETRTPKGRAKTPKNRTKTPNPKSRTPKAGTSTSNTETSTPNVGTKTPKNRTKTPKGTKTPKSQVKTPKNIPKIGTTTPKAGTRMPKVYTPIPDLPPTTSAEINLFEFNTKCLICMKNFSTRSDLQTHVNNAHISGKYRCEACEKTFTSVNRYQKHGCTKKSSKPFHCSNCGRGFNNILSLKWHLNLVHKSNLFECQKCFDKYIFFEDYAEHYKQCFGSAQLKIQLIKLSNEELLKYNVSAVKVKDSNYSCKKCSKNFKHLKNLNQHTKKCKKSPKRTPKRSPKESKNGIVYECHDCDKVECSNSRNH